MRYRVARREIAAALAAALLVGCDRPAVGPSVSAATPTPGIQATLLGTVVKGGPAPGVSVLVVRYSLAKDGKAVTGAAAAALAPSFTLAYLDTDPESGQPAWRSAILTGAETNPSLPLAGPGSANVLANQQQPGADSGGAVLELGGGAFTYTYGAPLQPLLAAGRTFRAGLFLAGTTGTARTCSTLDFTTDGSLPAANELVLDANCASCHGAAVRAHDGVRVGVRLCVTCHTQQNADPDTVDPAAMVDPVTAVAPTSATDPNPLDFGRLVHRVHRGRSLPTLYLSTSQAAAPALGAGTLPLPFSASVAARNALVAGRKFSVVGANSREYVFGKAVVRSDNGVTAKTIADGVWFPRDLRSCDACHANARQAARVNTEIHRRTCAGCHPDVWFRDDLTNGTDPNHLAHSGGHQTDDSRCAGCHVAAPADGSQKLYAPIADIHVPPQTSSHANAIVAQIVEVRDIVPGGVPDPNGGSLPVGPTVVFALADDDGTITPLNAPLPAMDANSPLPRAMTSLSLTIAGPTTDYLTSQFADPAKLPYTERPPLTTAADAQGRFTYTFKAVLPATATGTWTVNLDARRQAYVGATTTGATQVPHYDPATDSFRWPYTGESFTESPENALAYVDVAYGRWPGGNPVPRRKIIEWASCKSCHLRLNLHGGTRHDPETCVICHAPDRTDIGRRPGMASVVSGAPPTGTVNLAATYDDIEERSVDFRTLMHRIHTGAHDGSAQTPKPFVVANSFFFDIVRFPGDLTRCTSCHAGGTYELESIPTDARPVVANETPTIFHAGTGTHQPGEPTILPMAAACLSCHGSPSTALHAAANTTSRGESCKTCHGSGGTQSVDKVHGLTTP